MRQVQLHAYILIVVLGAALAGMLSARPLTLSGRPKTGFGMIPMALNGWSGVRGDFDAETKKRLPSCSLLLASYTNPRSPAPVELAIVYGTDLGDFHQPETCLQGSGLRILSKRNARVSPKGVSPFDTVAVIGESDFGKRAFLFWFTSESGTATFLGNYKARILLHRLLRGKVEPSAMVRLSTTVTNGEDDAVSELAHFAADLNPYLEKEFSSGAGASGR